MTKSNRKSSTTEDRNPRTSGGNTGRAFESNASGRGNNRNRGEGTDGGYGPSGSSGSSGYSSSGFRGGETERDGERDGGRGGERGGRTTIRGNTRELEHVSNRVTGKPQVSMTQASETVPLRTCADVCNETFSYCIEQGGEHVNAEHLKGLVDCAYICITTADFVSRGSPYADELKRICADVVKACEESCEEFEDDETMIACADTCRECYEHISR